MNNEQELEAFEAWWAKEGQYCRAGGGDYEKTFAYRAYQEGRRAALQSQDREDAERYRFIRAGDAIVWCSSGDDLLTHQQLDAAIDHARRVEGEAK